MVYHPTAWLYQQTNVYIGLNYCILVTFSLLNNAVLSRSWMTSTFTWRWRLSSRLLAIISTVVLYNRGPSCTRFTNSYYTLHFLRYSISVTAVWRWRRRASMRFSITYDYSRQSNIPSTVLQSTMHTCL